MLESDEIASRLVRVSSVARLEAMLNLTAFTEDPVFWQTFHQNWDACDSTWDVQDTVLDALEDRSNYGELAIPMSETQRAFLSNLATDKRGMIAVYRGCSRSRIRALSWTTDLNVANRFARGHRGIPVPDPVVVQAKIRKDDIFTVMLEREESEIVLRPHRLRYIREMPLAMP